MKMRSSKLRVGDWVEVRSKEEILRTLDSEGQLDGMPFMPEMFQWCGKRLQVYKRAHKTCDTVFPIRGRRVDRAVHLETRCNGEAHGGCQAGCLIFWKEAWLRRINVESPDGSSVQGEGQGGATPSRCSEAEVWARTQVSGRNGRAPAYVCQATQLPYATTDLAWWDMGQYVEDYLSGNAGLWRMVCALIYSRYYRLSLARIGLGPAMRWFYDKFHPLWRGTLFPRKTGTIPKGQPTPAVTLDLQPGELVRVKPHEEILRTLNTESRNRGLIFDAELVPYCGGTYQVLKRVAKIIDEKTGEMQEMKNPCIMLDTVMCQSRYSRCRLFCPRSIYSFWHEIWLERADPNNSDVSEHTVDRIASAADSSRDTAVTMSNSLVQIREG